MHIYVWVHDEVGAYRRTLSRYTPIGPFYGPREESRLKILPHQMVRTLSAIPRSRYTYGAFLMYSWPASAPSRLLRLARRFALPFCSLIPC